jgi:hypothetical protein
MQAFFQAKNKPESGVCKPLPAAGKTSISQGRKSEAAETASLFF